MMIKKTTCKECEFKNTIDCPYYGNEKARKQDCEGKNNLDCNICKIDTPCLDFLLCSKYL